MKKIGVLTLWNSEDNYGQVLQCYALNKTLSNCGYASFLLKYAVKAGQGSLFHKFSVFFKLLHTPSKLFDEIFKRIKKNICKQKNLPTRNFSLFRQKYIPSVEVVDVNELYNNSYLYDAFICGSDQIWNGINPVFFLDFVKAPVKKISYAPSLGGFIPNVEQSKYMRKLLSSFSYISVREMKSRDMLIEKNIANEVEHVPDPTLLLSSEDYLTISKKIKRKSKYLLLYLLGSKSKINFDKIYSFAKSENLEVVYVASQGRSDSYIKEYPSVEEWLGLIANAEYVVTNSFHGTVFSMIFHRKFCTILLESFFAATNGRVIELLERYDLSNRIYSNSFDLLKENIDYNLFDFLKEKDCKRVEMKLKNVLG